MAGDIPAGGGVGRSGDEGGGGKGEIGGVAV